uniref:Wd-repeat protein n=2 Tax=Tetraselmis sp. GSL018 TaxID=582737 RepID=A0A061R0U7_9CHLO
MGWENLPKQCLENVAAFGGGAAAATCQTVCQSWNAALDDWRIWKRLCDHELQTTSPFCNGEWKAGYREQAILARNWCKGTPRSFQALRAHDSCISGVAATDSAVVTASYDRTLKVWDGAANRWLHVLKGHSGPITCVAAHGAEAVSGARDRTVRLWDTAGGGEPLEEWPAGGAAADRCSPSAVAIVRAGGSGGGGADAPRSPTVVAAADTRGSVRVWRAGSPAVAMEAQPHRGAAYAMAPLSSGGHCASASVDGSACAWLAETGQVMYRVEHEEGLLAIAARDELLVTGGMDNAIHAWDLRSRSSVQKLEGHTDWVRGVGIHTHCIASGSKDRTVRLWDMRMGQETCQLEVDIETTSDVRSFDVSDSAVYAGLGGGVLACWSFGPLQG